MFTPVTSSLRSCSAVAISALYLALLDFLYDGLPLASGPDNISNVMLLFTSYMVELKYYSVAFAAIYARMRQQIFVQ
jgi:hypothetical protein